MQPTFSLPAELTIYTVGELYPQCLVWMRANARQDLPVQAQDVREVDAAGVQLLLSWSCTLSSEQRGLHLVGPSAALVA
ncbi:STAS domain-containing protein, partial [uncultured Sphaerotilus sp.]|uniref:STAS domain-containing protein n=1 Tax=uncultured Sphaerotilus sp. TaxID=474984 RepID=UPI0030CA4C5F